MDVHQNARRTLSCRVLWVERIRPEAGGGASEAAVACEDTRTSVTWSVRSRTASATIVPLSARSARTINRTLSGLLSGAKKGSGGPPGPARRNEHGEVGEGARTPEHFSISSSMITRWRRGREEE